MQQQTTVDAVFTLSTLASLNPQITMRPTLSIAPRRCIHTFHTYSSSFARIIALASSRRIGFVVNGCVNVVITTIERRFGLSSSQTGLVASGYDIASFLALVPVTYFGGRAGASKPRWVGGGVVVLGLGSLLFALPHFLVGPYRQAGAAGAAGSTMCMATTSAAVAAAAAPVSGNETTAADVLKVSS